jgi:hypothetical protein
MAHIEKLAADCMRDVEEEEVEEEGLEEDVDLLVRLPGWYPRALLLISDLVEERAVERRPWVYPSGSLNFQ